MEHRDAIDCPCIPAGYVQTVMVLTPMGATHGWVVHYSHYPVKARARRGVGHP